LIQACPICGAAVPASPRYPRRLCSACVARACDADGAALAFFNTAASGGYGARYAASGLAYPHHHCFVDGTRCRADEAYMGGIVVQADDAETPSS